MKTLEQLKDLIACEIAFHHDMESEFEQKFNFAFEKDCYEAGGFYLTCETAEKQIVKELHLIQEYIWYESDCHLIQEFILMQTLFYSPKGEVDCNDNNAIVDIKTFNALNNVYNQTLDD